MIQIRTRYAAIPLAAGSIVMGISSYIAEGLGKHLQQEGYNQINESTHLSNGLQGVATFMGSIKVLLGHVFTAGSLFTKQVSQIGLVASLALALMDVRNSPPCHISL